MFQLSGSSPLLHESLIRTRFVVRFTHALIVLLVVAIADTAVTATAAPVTANTVLIMSSSRLKCSWSGSHDRAHLGVRYCGGGRK
jgi:hypothetical protein